MNLNFENCQKQLVFTQPRTILLSSRLQHRWPQNSFAHGCGLRHFTTLSTHLLAAWSNPRLQGHLYHLGIMELLSITEHLLQDLCHVVNGLECHLLEKQNRNKLRVLKNRQLWPYANTLIWFRIVQFIHKYRRCFTCVLSSGRSNVFNISSTQLLPPPVSAAVSALPVTRELISFLRSWKRW